LAHNCAEVVHAWQSDKQKKEPALLQAQSKTEEEESISGEFTDSMNFKHSPLS
jgi:hypothetical protein